MKDPAHGQRLRETLYAHYDRWRALSQAEAAAIEAGDWPQVSQIQQDKARLQSVIDKARHDLRTESMIGELDAEQLQIDFRPTIEHLIEMERQNARLLSSRQQRIARQQDNLRAAARTLHQLRRTYATERQPVWQSYG